jgi:hypothetical protein
MELKWKQQKLKVIFKGTCKSYGGIYGDLFYSRNAADDTGHYSQHTAARRGRGFIPRTLYIRRSLLGFYVGVFYFSNPNFLPA